jgi:predicted RNase H-like HicB family nuclease
MPTVAGKETLMQLSYTVIYRDGEWHASCSMFPDLHHCHDCPRKALDGLFALFDAMVEDAHASGPN